MHSFKCVQTCLTNAALKLNELITRFESAFIEGLIHPKHSAMRDSRQEPLPTRMVVTAEQHEGHCQYLLQAIAQDLVELGLWHPGHRNLSHPSI